MKIKNRTTIKLGNCILARDEDGFKIIVDAGLRAPTVEDIYVAISQRIGELNRELSFLMAAAADARVDADAAGEGTGP